MLAGRRGNTGSVCGAVVCTVMAIVLKKGQTATWEGILRNLAKAAEFRRRFEPEIGTISCRELTGMDLSTEKVGEQFMNSDIPKRICIPEVGAAYRIVVDLLKETSS